MPAFGTRSRERLEQAHPYLQLLFNEVVKEFDCSILEAYRGKEKQDRMVLDGKSKLGFPNSKHNKMPSLAVDVVPYFREAPHVQWANEKAFHVFAGYVLGVADRLGIKIIWGGNWKNEDIFRQDFEDLPHFQLELEKE